MQILSPIYHLADFCYPRVCATCDAIDSAAKPICSDCFHELNKLAAAPACSQCSMPIAMHNTSCPHCLGEGNRPFDRIARLSIFRDPVRHLIHQIKYRGKWPLAEFLADRLLEQHAVKQLLDAADVIVPVPLHPWRQISRGYNQAELIARRMGKRSRVKIATPILRLKDTQTQTHLHSKESRFENLRDAFALTHPKKIRDQHVVIVDDVMTTGATLKSVARTITEAEPASLSAIVIAVADSRRQDFAAI